MKEWLKKAGYDADPVILGIATSSFVPSKGVILAVGVVDSRPGGVQDVMCVQGIESTADIAKNTGFTQAMLDSGSPLEEIQDRLLDMLAGRFVVSYAFDTFLSKWLGAPPLEGVDMPEVLDVQTWSYYLDTYSSLPQHATCIADVHDHVSKVIPKRIGNFDTHCFEKTGWVCPDNFEGTTLDKRLEQTTRLWQILRERTPC